MFTYVYTGDEPTAFISLRKDGVTWTPSKGDEIESDEVLRHPLLAIVPPKQEIIHSANPEQTESPETADETEE